MNNILAALAEIADTFRTKAEQKSKEVRAPSDIEFSQTSPIESGGQASVEVHATHPAVFAYEYGSGIHATRGQKGLYPIKAKGADPLHFFWKERSKWFIGMELPFGHPGVEARPFMKPTLDENQAEFKQKLGQAFKVEILAGTQKIEVIEIK